LDRLGRRGLPDSVEDVACDPLWVSPEVAFPNSNDAPTETPEPAGNQSITPPISLDLCGPVVSVPTSGELCLSLSPAPPVPKVAVAENDNSIGSNNQVRVAGYVRGMQAITNSYGR
jgi:hypothetical protein